MATILAHITITAGKEAEFEAVAQKMHAASHATEPHLRAYGYWRGSEPRTFYTLLAFDSFLDFIAHQTSDHHESLSAQITGCIEAMRLEWVDPIQGASTLPPTVSQDAPADADELTARYAKRFAAQIAAWWPRRP